jgi:2-iminobutanoate/2-iminopropanoate deaminase
MRNVVCTSKSPGVGPYPQAVRGCGFIFVSGQLALDPATRQIIEGDARQQTERALQNIAAILEASGSNLDKVMRCGVFLKNLSDFEAMNDVYGKVFGSSSDAYKHEWASFTTKEFPENAAACSGDLNAIKAPRTRYV